MNEKVKFLPWVGSEYTRGINGKKVMVLGESHYCAHESEAVPELTRIIIRDLFDDKSEHEGYKNTYTKFGRALAGKQLYDKDKEAVWNSVVFYNYVQVPLSEARKEPKVQDFTNSEIAFFDVLEQYHPDCLIVWGKRLYNNLPRRGYQTDDLIMPDGSKIETWTYELANGHRVYLLPITHPSAAFTPEYWHDAIHRFIRRL